MSHGYSIPDDNDSLLCVIYGILTHFCPRPQLGLISLCSHSIETYLVYAFRCRSRETNDKDLDKTYILRYEILCQKTFQESYLVLRQLVSVINTHKMHINHFHKPINPPGIN